MNWHAITSRLKNEVSLLRYSLRLLAGPGLVAIVLISAVMVVLIVTGSSSTFETKLGNLLFQMETFGPLLGIVVFSGLIGMDLDSRRVDTLRTSAEGIVRLVLRKLFHATVFTAATYLIVLCLARVTYTPFDVLWGLGVVLPGALYFGMFGLLVTAATRRTMAGYAAGTSALLISIAGTQVEPLLMSSYTFRSRLAIERFFEDRNWLIAKIFFLAMTVVLAVFVLRSARNLRARFRPALEAGVVLIAAYAGVHALWIRPVRQERLPSDKILDIRQKDDALLVRVARTGLSIRKRRSRLVTSVRQDDYARDGDQWVRKSESTYYPNSEVDLVHTDIECTVAPEVPEIQATARLQMRAMTGPLYRVFFFLGWDLQIVDFKLNREAANFTKHGNLVEVFLPTPALAGDVLNLEFQYAGPLTDQSEGVARDFVPVTEPWYPTTKASTQNWVDPFTFRARVRLPPSWRLAGATLRKDENGQSVFQWESRIPIHLFPLYVGKFRHYSTLYRDIPITVSAFTFDQAFAQRLLDRCIEILRIHEQAFGPYPFAQLAFVENRFQGASGVACPGFMAIRSERLTPEKETGLFDLLLPHEIAHQWWRTGLPKWIAEGGAVYANYRFLDQTQGRQQATALLDETVYEPYMRSNTPMTPLVTEFRYPLSIYARGSYLLVMLESRLGKDAVLKAMRGFYERHVDDSMADEEAMNQDFQRTLQQAVGEDLHPFISDWMRSTKRFDPAIVALQQNKVDSTHDIIVRLAHRAGLRFPVPVRVTFTDGRTTDVTWSGRETEGEVHLQSAQPAVKAEIDAKHVLLDWNRGNNRTAPTIAGKTVPHQETPTTDGWRTYTTQDGLNAPTVRSLLFGNDRRLYVGSGREGVIGSSNWDLNYFDGQWHDLVPDSSRGVTILSMAQASDGTLWVGGHGVLWRVKGGEAKRLVLKERRHGSVGKASFTPNPAADSEIPGSTVFALLCDGHGNVWVGTDHGVSTLDMDRGTWRHFSQADKLPGQAVLALERDDGGVIWAGTDRGIASFSHGQWTLHPQYARHDMILAIATDSQGTVWFGTFRSGILGLGNGSLQRFTSANSPLPHDMVSSLTCDPDGRLWAGTADGLACFDGQSWRHFHQRNSGLPSNRIQRLAVDDSGHLWIGTDVGLTCYDD